VVLVVVVVVVEVWGVESSLGTPPDTGNALQEA
jgi:hypothetical protein